MSRNDVPVSVLLESLPERQLIGEPPTVVRGLTADSRRVEAGDCFVAVPGFKQDARRFVPDAVARGARLVVTEGDALAGLNVAQVLVPSARRALRFWSRFGGNASPLPNMMSQHTCPPATGEPVPASSVPVGELFVRGDGFDAFQEPALLQHYVIDGSPPHFHATSDAILTPTGGGAAWRPRRRVSCLLQ